MISRNIMEIYLPDTVFNNDDGRISLDYIKSAVLKKANAKGLSLSAKTDVIRGNGILSLKNDPCVVFFRTNRYNESIKLVIKVSLKGKNAVISAGVANEDSSTSFLGRLQSRFSRYNYIKENYFREALNEEYTEFFHEAVNELFGTVKLL